MLSKTKISKDKLTNDLGHFSCDEKSGNFNENKEIFLKIYNEAIDYKYKYLQEFANIYKLIYEEIKDSKIKEAMTLILKDVTNKYTSFMKRIIKLKELEFKREYMIDEKWLTFEYKF